jgi:Zn-dependent metalloprotease
MDGEPAAQTPELGVLSDPDTHAAPAYRVDVSAQSADCLAPSVFVDAKSGAPIKIEERAHSLEATVGGSRFFRLKDFRDVKPVSVTNVPGSSSKFQMISDDTPSTRVITRAFASQQVIQTSDIAHWDESSSAKGAAVDAHYHTRQALVFLRPFADKFMMHGRDFVFPLSLDVNVSVHDNSAANSNGFNAFALFDETKGMDLVDFGDGNFPAVPNALPFSAVYDVVAHEVTHLVTAHTSKLKYERESGALNESFSDVMGASAEHALFPDEKNNVLIGEALFDPAVVGPINVLRSMAAPRSTGSPDHREDEIPCPAAGPTPDNDQCGVHSNSGIPNRAFSLIVAGGSMRTSLATRFRSSASVAPILRPSSDRPSASRRRRHRDRRPVPRL